MVSFNTSHKKNRIANFIMDLLCIILLITFFVPQVHLLPFYQYIWLGAMLAWSIVSLFANVKFYLGNSKFVRLSLMYLLYTILIPYVVGVDIIGNRYLSLASVIVFYWIYEYNSKYRSIKDNLRIIYCSAPIILYTSVTTLIALFTNPWIVRIIKSGGEETMAIWATGVSGYELIYSTLILVVSILPLVLEQKRLNTKIMHKLILIGFMVLGGLLIIYSNYFTAFCVLFFAVLLLLALYYDRKLLFVLTPIALVYFIFSTDINLAIINGLMYIVPVDGLTYDRLMQIQNQIQGVIIDADVNSRSEVTAMSLNIISRYPIAGAVLGSTSFDLSQIGQHSYVLDTFAFFGIFVGGYMIYIMTFPFLERVKRTNSYRLRVFAMIVGFTFLTLITTNNITPTMGYAALFVFPTIYDYLKIKKI